MRISFSSDRNNFLFFGAITFNSTKRAINPKVGVRDPKCKGIFSDIGSDPILHSFKVSFVESTMVISKTEKLFRFDAPK